MHVTGSIVLSNKKRNSRKYSEVFLKHFPKKKKVIWRTLYNISQDSDLRYWITTFYFCLSANYFKFSIRVKGGFCSSYFYEDKLNGLFLTFEPSESNNQFTAIFIHKWQKSIVLRGGLIVILKKHQKLETVEPIKGTYPNLNWTVF